jgi:hypothetical protein
MTRRDSLKRLAALAAAGRFAGGAAMAQRNAREAVDHLLLGARDLDEGIAWLERRTGVRAVAGGVHPGMGTRNALASLGGRQYLEIIAPDPAQSAFNFQLDIRTLAEPGLVTWAASATSVDDAAAAARAAGLGVFGPRDGSRQRPDGVLLKWRSVGVDAKLSSGTIDPFPFFIQWAADSRHPAADAPSGLRLSAFTLRHPDAEKLRRTLTTFGIDAAVDASNAAGLRATLDTPNGQVVLSS